MAALEELGVPYCESEWEHGLMCAECPHVFREGARFTALLYAFSDDVPMALVCVPCATDEPTRASGSVQLEPRA